ncbi:MAG: hypothetical protein RLZZ463_748 [Bacteroidota bacterium]
MKNFRLPLLISASLILVLLFNYLANALPLGGITTGQASDRLPNLFTPTGATFSIWGLIYTLLLAYIIAFWIQRPDQITGEAGAVTQAHSRWLVINFGANVLWILAWHHLLIGLSMAIMLLILFSLIRMAQIGVGGGGGPPHPTPVAPKRHRTLFRLDYRGHHRQCYCAIGLPKFFWLGYCRRPVDLCDIVGWGCDCLCHPDQIQKPYVRYRCHLGLDRDLEQTHRS